MPKARVSGLGDGARLCQRGTPALPGGTRTFLLRLRRVTWDSLISLLKEVALLWAMQLTSREAAAGGHPPGLFGLRARVQPGPDGRVSPVVRLGRGSVFLAREPLPGSCVVEWLWGPWIDREYQVLGFLGWFVSVGLSKASSPKL